MSIRARMGSQMSPRRFLERQDGFALDEHADLLAVEDSVDELDHPHDREEVRRPAVLRRVGLDLRPQARRHHVFDGEGMQAVLDRERTDRPGIVQPVDVDPADLDPRCAAGVDEGVEVGDLVLLDAVGRVVDDRDRHADGGRRHRLEVGHEDAGLRPGLAAPEARRKLEAFGVAGVGFFVGHAAKDRPPGRRGGACPARATGAKFKRSLL